MEINKTVSILLILLIAVTAFFVFVVPEYQRSKELELNLETRQAQYANQSSYYAKTSETLSKIENNQDALAKINSALPSELSLSSIVYFLQKKGAEAGMSVKSVTFSGAPSDAYVSPVAVEAGQERFTCVPTAVAVSVFIFTYG
jgi:Tfp pilus assembly protein PilO